MVSSDSNVPQSDEIKIRRANANDLFELWQWRNDKQTMMMFKSTSEVTWQSHSEWFAKIQSGNNNYLYIGFNDNGEKIGACRFDLNEIKNAAEISINLNPDFRRKNLSHQLLSKSMEIFTKELKINVIAKIKKINMPSIKCFIKAGFILQSEDLEYKYFQKIYPD